MASEPMSALRAAAPLMKHAHIENALTRALPADADGEDYARFFTTLRDIGYTGGIGVRGHIDSAFRSQALEALHTIQRIQRGIV